MNNQQQTQDQNIPLMASLVTRALAYTENGGAPNINNPSAGKTGESKSIFQYEPDTWKADAGKYLGDPNAPLTADNETTVAKGQVTDWLKKGYKVNQIASMWNAGIGEPDAYSGKFSDGTSSQGVNKQYGVKYDVPGYAKKVENYTKQFIQEAQKSQLNNQTQPTVNSQTPPQISSKPPVFNNQTNAIKGSPFSRVMAEKSKNKVKKE
jgi:hypothetical protein